ncbi:ABC transporter ATP-binding protein [Pediococcus acidilactici]|uniref:ABC transporter ATP-binding protein n=1 Tax=Pediococcus acidilactici TaxID=1254 RepID=UPI002935BBC1|nr:ABC transporter ATP-binding protein [Pediococcus acidilactici]MDV2603319.1 ABC transporter ATP-binding protein [Pediococcus acidilactici]MDV2844740.1 ABC transporter ATP-binding protein [Pediococcus acidilactici]WQS21672.1 ABC transporter ATP-binding protein [Pediococcus acidilactici]WQS26981.1 ABC transporter ATP-binding protein [Pediococcus acidilactici]
MAKPTKPVNAPRPGRHGGPGGVIEKPQNFWKSAVRLAKYLSPWMFGFIIVLILAALSTLLQIRAPKVLGEATTEIFKGVMKGAMKMKMGMPVHHFPVNFDKVFQILVTVGILYGLSAAFSFIQQVVMTRVSQKAVAQLRSDFKDKMQKLPISYYDTHSNGDIMSRMTNDMDNISSTLQQSLTQLVTSALQFVGVLYMMLTISWKLTLVAVATVPLSLIVVTIVAPKSQRYFKSQQKHLGLMNDQVEETYAGHTVIKTYNHEQKAIEDFEKENAKYYRSAWKAQFISGLIMPLMNFVKNLGYLMVAVLGGVQVAHGGLSLGNVQAFLQYTQQFSQPITQVANIANTLQMTMASAERVFEVLDQPEMEETHTDVAKVDTSAKVIIDDVDFRYVPDKPLIRNFNLRVEPGEMVAIVGPTGAGKTTIINLLERFYDVNSGTIYLDGEDTRNMPRNELRKHIAMVLQDTWLFTGTIRENIKYGREGATDEEMYAAAKAAHADGFIRQLPDGYDTVLNEAASNISQGQRQLLTIARAFLADPDILILDEATSSVDTRTEVLIQKAMNRLLKNRTSFVVAHRLSTIRNAQNIVVMNHGQIVETGNHDGLMAQNGFYADLYNSQFASGEVI